MTYVVYNSVNDLRRLDLNNIDANKTVVFPGYLYGGEALPVSQYMMCSGPRDTRTQYFVDAETNGQHPDHFSRFDYARTFYGYGSGIWMGRYNEPPNCMAESNPQPKDMAPPIFYGEKYLSPFYSDSPAYLHDRLLREHGR
jgi:hypothetical protein